MWDEMRKKYKQAYVRRTTLAIWWNADIQKKGGGYGMTYVGGVGRCRCIICVGKERAKGQGEYIGKVI